MDHTQYPENGGGGEAWLTCSLCMAHIWPIWILNSEAPSLSKSIKIYQHLMSSINTAQAPWTPINKYENLLAPDIVHQNQ